MALKKQERKNALLEIYKLLAKADDNEFAKEARLKVINMLSHDGLFILEAAQETKNDKPN